jgi:hypothetical protein
MSRAMATRAGWRKTSSFKQKQPKRASAVLAISHCFMIFGMDFRLLQAV